MFGPRSLIWRYEKDKSTEIESMTNSSFVAQASDLDFLA